MAHPSIATRRWSTGGVALLCTAALLTAAPASADQNDDGFVAALQKGGITVPDRNTAITMGHNVCGELAKGKPRTAVVMSLVESTDLSSRDSGYFVGVSVAAYCPQFKPGIGPSTPAPGN